MNYKIAIKMYIDKYYKFGNPVLYSTVMLIMRS